MAESKNEGNIKNNSRTANGGMDMDNSINQIGNTKISYGLNAMVESFDNTSTSYQNEPGFEDRAADWGCGYHGCSRLPPCAF